jgi:hypothetical protein
MFPLRSVALIPPFSSFPMLRLPTRSQFWKSPAEGESGQPSRSVQDPGTPPFVGWRFGRREEVQPKDSDFPKVKSSDGNRRRDTIGSFYCFRLDALDPIKVRRNRREPRRGGSGNSTSPTKCSLGGFLNFLTTQNFGVGCRLSAYSAPFSQKNNERT